MRFVCGRSSLAWSIVTSCLLWFAAAGVARADLQDDFTGNTLAPSWTIHDGYAAHYPADVTNHASFAMTGNHLSISFPGGQEHNQWWLDHAQITRAFPGSGVYEIKVDSAVTGSQQFGIVFENSPGTFMMFMVYASDQIYAYVERFAQIGGQQYKTTVFGTALGLQLPTAGPYYVRVTLDDHADPSNRTWHFQWSNNGVNWTSLVSGVLEGPYNGGNAGTIQQVGLFAGNQPYGFDGFNAQFDYFRFTSPASLPTDAPSELVARGGDQVVNLWWKAVSGADSYTVYRRLSSGGTFASIGVTATPSFDDASASNGTRYTYAVTAHKNGVESATSTSVDAVPHVLTSMQGLPSAGLVLALSASELAYITANGQQVLQWPNVLGPKRAATALGTSAPQFVTSGVNGAPAVRFDGVNDFLSLPTNGFENFTAGISLYVVMRPTVLQSGFKILALGNGPGQQNVVLGRAGSSAGLQYFTDNSSGNVQWFNTDHGLAANDSTLISLQQESGAANSLSFAEIARNGVAVNGQNVWVPPVTARAVNYIGKSYWNEGMFQGDIAEVLLYNRTLTASEQTAVKSYIATKYGINVSGTGEPPPPPPPPPPLTAPTGLVANGGDNAIALSWDVVTGAIGYRVYRSNVPAGGFAQIADLTGINYADTGVANGTAYRYVVTAYKPAEESVASVEVSATPSAPLPPNEGIPTDGLILSLDAQTALIQYGNGGAVPSWQDTSVFSHHAIVSGGGAPKVVSNAIGGRPAVRFDGLDDFLTLPTSGFENFTAGISLYVVMKPTVLQSGFKILALGNGPGQQNIVLGRAGSSPGLQYFTDNSSGNVEWFNTSDGLFAGDTALVSLLQGAGTANGVSDAAVSRNGVLLGNKNVWVPPVTTRAVNYLGKSYWNEGLLQGDVAEILLYNRILNATEQAAVKTYVAQKYGISVQ